MDELAQEVLDSKWGNGTDRKERLTAAGYDYSAVQAKVNALAKKQESAPVCYTVKSGDTLSGIARKYGTTVSAIQKLNPTFSFAYFFIKLAPAFHAFPTCFPET